MESGGQKGELSQLTTGKLHTQQEEAHTLLLSQQEEESFPPPPATAQPMRESALSQ